MDTVTGDEESGQSCEHDEFLTRREAARRIGVTPATITGWIRDGHVPVTRRGHSTIPNIRPADLEAAQDRAHVGGVVPRWRQDRHHAAYRLRALREMAGKTQQEVAAETGLTHEVISRIERGKVAPKAETIRKLADALGVPAERFVEEELVGPTLLPIAEVATYLDVPVDRVRDWVKEGRLEGNKISGQWRVPAIAMIELDRSGRLRGRSRRLDPRFRGDTS